MDYIKEMEKHAANYEWLSEDKREMFEDDLKRFKNWVANAGERELMRQLLGRFESVAYSYELMKEAEAGEKALSGFKRRLEYLKNNQNL